MGAIMIDFTPIDDEIWRTESKQTILSSHSIPNFMKLHLLHMWGYIGWLLFPISISLKVLGFIISSGKNTDEVHTTKSHELKDDKQANKTESYGYGVNIFLLKDLKNIMHDDHILKELAGSMNIFANPQGNHFVTKNPKTLQYKKIARKIGKDACILNTTELARIIHLPTLYVKTPGINWVMSRKFEVPHNLPSITSPNTPI